MIGLVAAIAVLPLLGAVGSRTALAAGVPAFAISAYLLLRDNERIKKLMKRHRKIAVAISLVVLGATALVVITFGSAAQRIGAIDVSEIRFNIWRASWNVMARYFPVGSGFGSFDAVYRAGEPLTTLGPYYINHAHNDFLELALEGGVLALGILILGIIWFAVRTMRVISARRQPKSLALAGVAIIVVLLIGSTTDYPLRVPSLMAVMAIALVWLSEAGLRTRALWR
jgi:O-antigen ligase